MNRFFSILVVVLVLMFGVQNSFGDYPSKDLVKALAIHESNDNPMAIGDKGIPDHAYGHLQIRQPCVDDVNRKFGTHYRAKDCLGNRELSEWICREYINLYAIDKSLGHKPTDQDKARIWNGGPKGYRFRKTIAYWWDISKLLRKLES